MDKVKEKSPTSVTWQILFSVHKKYQGESMNLGHNRNFVTEVEGIEERKVEGKILLNE